MQSRNVGLVAVGVDKTGVLATLRGAASGAARISQWLRGQAAFGVSSVITELTDVAGAKVSARDVQDAVRELIDRGDIDLLIMYFAGHGIVKSGNDEQVLLSEVKKYKDEAIAIAPTILNSFYSTVPHVVIISDACRNAIEAFGELGSVAGKPALDRRAVAGVKKSKVDVLYATEPSQTAKEFEGEGFFTEVLVDALENPPAGVRDLWAGLDDGVEVIQTWKLEQYLSVEVPLRASRRRPPFEQTPDFYITSREPLFIGYTKAPVPDADEVRVRWFGFDDGVDLGRRVISEVVRTRDAALTEVVQVLNSYSFGMKEVATHLPIDAGLADHVSAYLGSEHGRQSFETRTGYSVIGGAVDKVLLSGGHSLQLADTHEGTKSVDVRLYPSPFSQGPLEQRGSVGLIFKGGTLCILPILPGYIGTVNLRDGRVASVSFEVSQQLRHGLGETDADIKDFAKRRALAAALASSGKLQKLAKEEGAAYGSFIRQSKRADPALGIYAAYAYALSGDDEGARSVFQWMRDYPSLDPATGLPPAPVPFDVALLAGQLPQAFDIEPAVAPFCPMMTLGWSVISSYLPDELLHESIGAAGRHRLNCEWTTFQIKDVRSMLDAFERGELI